MSHSSKSSNLRKESWEASVYGWLVTSTGGNLGLVTGI